jgi:hypothetical protein
MYPWVGADYQTIGYRGRRLLILGESEYEWEKDALVPEIATWLIAANVKGTLRNPFYTKIYNAFSDEPKAKSLPQFAAFWNSVAFYNYIQEKVGPTPRLRPTPEMWPRWRPVFLQVLNCLRPDRVLILGRALQWNLKGLGLLEESDGPNQCRIVGGGLNIKAAYIPHPASFGFKPASWRPVTCSLLEKE